MTGAKTPILHGVLQGDLDAGGFRILNLDLSSLASGAPFSDATALVRGSDDATKLMRFEIDGFTTATTRAFTLPNYDAQLATLAGAEALTGKTVLGLRSSLAAFDLRLASAESLSAARTLTLFVDDADRNVQFGGDVVFADEFTTIGAFPIVLTAAGSTALTLPTSGTLATTAQVPVISDVAYNAATWNGNLDGASKNAIRDKIESITSGTTPLQPFDDDKAILFNNLDATKLLKISLTGLATATTRTLTVQDKNGTIACLDDIPDVNGMLFETDQPGRTIYLAGNVAFFGDVTFEGGFLTTFHCTGITDLTLPQQGTLATLDGEETFTNKGIEGGTVESITKLSLRSSGSAFDLTIEPNAVMTSNRKLLLALGNADRTLTLANDFETAGNFKITLTALAASSVTLPITGTIGAFVSVPASAGASGKANQMAHDEDFLYVCIADSTWLRTALVTW